MIALIRKLSQQTEATIAKVGIAKIKTACQRLKYAGKRAGARPGGRKKLVKGGMGDRELLERVGMGVRERDETAAERAKAKARRATGTKRGTGSTARASGTAQKATVCFTQTPAMF